MGSRSVLLILVVLGGCEKKQPRLEGPIDITLGDCAPTTVAFVSGPRPEAFDPATVGRPEVAEEDPPPTDEDPDAGGESGGAFASLTGTGDISSGFDDQDIYGGLTAQEAGEMQSGFGSGTSSGYGVGGGRAGRRGPVPTLAVGQPSANGDLDKAIIRRYIKRNLQKIQYCYEKELLAKPTLEGTVMTQFLIKPDGTVGKTSGTGVDPEVAKCVTNVIKGIEFPKPQNGGNVQVNYPFTFRPAGNSAATPPTPSAPPAPEPPKPEPPKAAPPKPPYRAGATTPLRAIEHELVDCFRLQSKRHGVAVIDLASDKLTAHGIENAAWKSCASKLAKKVKPASATPLRCSVAFGPMPVAEAPSVMIKASAIEYLGNKVGDILSVFADDKSFKIGLLFEAADKRAQDLLATQQPVTLHGPTIIKPLDDTPMRVVNVVQTSLRAAGDDPVFAVKRGDDWKLLRPIDLPAVPVPVGTGGSWNHPRSPRDVAVVEERVHLSILVAEDRVWLGLSRVNEFSEVKDGDPAKLAAQLAHHKQSPFFAGRTDLEIAGDAKVPYSKVVAVIEAATKAGFTGWVVEDPMGLSARPQL